MPNKENKQPTYRVEFKQPTFDLPRTAFVIADKIPQMEMAVKFALSLHEASNVAHTIHVIHDDIIDVTFVRYDQPTNV